MKIACPDNFRTVFHARNCGRRPSLSGLMIFSVVLGTFTLFAGDPIFTDAPAASPATNAPQGSPATLLQASTNVSQTGITNSMDALDDKHTLAIGDVLSFRIVEDEEEPRPLVVTDSGDLEVPYLGRFPAENRTCKQLARELKAALEKEYYYQATVIIAVNSMAKSRGKVYLVGPVRMPGPQDLPSDEVLTLSKAILRAGGFTDFADKHNVKITRQGSDGKSDKVTLVVDVGQIFDKGKTEKDVALKPGDLIYIPERMVRF
jgi:protein involved in polysaccharide export with SLBB domain